MTPLHALVFLYLALVPAAASAADEPQAAAAPEPGPAQAAPPAAPGSDTAGAATGQDFIAEARLLTRVFACTGDDPLPPHIDAKVVEDHCKGMLPKMKKYAQKYGDEAEKFIGELRPKALPTTVVYPFGGGDLISALTTYPNATEITTMSLEHAGDPRRIMSVNRAKLQESLAKLKRNIHGLLSADNSTTENLMKGQRGDIPGQLAFFIVALAAHNYEPVSLRFFRIEPDGTLHYLTADEIAAKEKESAKLLKKGWVSPEFSVSFSNSELAFRPRGGSPDATTRVHRHIAANLANAVLDKDPSVLKHLEAKGKVAAMTKAASYLLWRDEFSRIRDYLLTHMVFMVSDSTGIPPKYASKAGFEQETWGRFSASFLNASPEHNEDFRNLFKKHADRTLPFRYGYIDKAGHNHMLVTRPTPQP